MTDIDIPLRRVYIEYLRNVFKYTNPEIEKAFKQAKDILKYTEDRIDWSDEIIVLEITTRDILEKRPYIMKQVSDMEKANKELSK